MHALEPGSRVAPHYVIVDRIGEGGMGVVYRARDERLGREVALKVLPLDALGSPDAVQRFAAEARTASALNHPNIVTILDVGRSGDLHFIAEELVVGRTLRNRLGDGPLTVSDALDIAIQITSALAATQAAGIVHRDIKPENVMIRRDGLVKVLDFGLAKVAQAPADAATAAHEVHTKTGIVLGTVRYMSPEQARGLPIDARSDIFSVGVLLFEMLAGRPPFSGQTFTDTMVAIVHEKARPLDEVAPDVPPGVARIVAKALRKRSDERYQQASDLLADLKAEQTLLSAPNMSEPIVAKASARISRRTVAAVGAIAIVLAAGATFIVHPWSARTAALTDKDTILLADFTNTTGEPMFDGQTLRQALLVQLQQTPFLNVFPDQATATTLTLMERKPDERITGAVAREICLRQHLNAMVSGSIARLGQHYVITLEATEPQSGNSIAVQQAEAGAAEQVLAALGTAAAGLRARLGEAVGTLQQYNTPIEQATTSSLEALKAYSEGQRLMQREDGRGALPFFLRAIELDPDFVAAYDGGAWAQTISGAPAKAMEFARIGYEKRLRATELEQLSVTETYHHFVTGDYEQDIKTADVWARLFPKDWTPHTVYALDYPAIGRLAESADASRTIVELNPDVAQGYRFLVTALVPLQRYDDAAQAIAQARSRGLDNVFVRRAEFAMTVARDDLAGIERTLGALAEHDGRGEELAWRARLAATEGRWQRAREIYLRGQPAGAPALPVEAIGVQALFGLCEPKDAVRAFATGRIVSPAVTATVMAPDGSLCGEVPVAEQFASELERRFPASTIARNIALPQLRAAIALRQHRPDVALETLRSIVAEGTADAYRSYYLRGQAHLALRHDAEAAADFQVILDHRGWAPFSPVYPLARLGQARALAHAGDTAAARRSYQQFLAMWKDADQDLPVLQAAKREASAL